MSTLLYITSTSVGVAVLLSRVAPTYTCGATPTAILLFVLAYFLYASWYVVIYPRYFSPLRKLPQAPDGHWLWGQTARIMRESSGMPMRDWAEHVPNSGLIRYSNLFQERVLLTTPSTLSEVLVSKNYDFIKPPAFKKGIGQVIGIGVLFAEGDEHRTQRKNLSPAFAFRHIKDLYPTFWIKSRELVECLTQALESPITTSDKGNTKSNVVDVGSWTSRATLDIIGISGMGQDFDSLRDPNNKLYQTYQSIFKTSQSDRYFRLLALLVPFEILKRIPTRRNKEMAAAIEYIKHTCRQLITKKKQTIAEKGNAEFDIVSVALQSGVFQDENLVNQIMTFLIAGHETTATAMVWALYLLSKHKGVQQKLRDEVRRKLPSLKQDITASDIDDCHYLQAVASEILRIWPPVFMTMRVAERPTSIAGEFIPRGTTIIITPWAINRSTQLWGQDAENFKPERWIGEDGKSDNKGGAISNFSFLTFLHGPRSCIGEKFARAEFACLLAAWIGSFETDFEEGSPLATSEPDVQGGVTSKPKGGLRCQLKRVPGW